jgi:hypothetical protein
MSSNCAKTRTIWIFFFLPEIIYAGDDERNRLRYFGQLDNGVPNGHGTMAWKDGQSYKGTEQLKKLLYINKGIKILH